MNRGVVIGYDGSASGTRAVDWGCKLAERHGATVHLLRAYEPFTYDSAGAARRGDGTHVRDAGEMVRSARQGLERVAASVRAAHPRLTVTCSLERTDAEAALVRASRTADTVVLGSRGTSAFSTLVAGSVTTYVAAHAHCPVVAVPQGISGEADLGDQVVVGVDGSELSNAAVAFAFEEASVSGSPLLALHAWLDPAVRAALRPLLVPVADPSAVTQRKELLLAEALVGWSEKYPDVRVTGRVVHGHPVHALVGSAEGARMLVVGSRGHGPVRSLILGSVGHGLLHLARCPVAVVR